MVMELVPALRGRGMSSGQAELDLREGSDHPIRFKHHYLGQDPLYSGVAIQLTRRTVLPEPCPLFPD
jgi:hypothetical protein